MNVIVHSQNGASALLMASEQGHLNIVKILLQHSARVDVFDEVTDVTSLLNGVLFILSIHLWFFSLYLSLIHI